jgi:hypothetical protein
MTNLANNIKSDKQSRYVNGQLRQPTTNKKRKSTVLSRAKADLLYSHIDFWCRETSRDGLVLDRAGYQWLLGHGMTRPEVEQAVEKLLSCRSAQAKPASTPIPSVYGPYRLPR